ncbi:hypothetical protein IF1G_05862 [Cordyceps javanica]|uniref:Uncharacterized protein n=1 Tax=Cordyceps javanica TaxID=43265 RepID=A0A545V2V8_9HYPO|nr:hypothetical protein IF1G_05862 [Cordyceps javanica]
MWGGGEGGPLFPSSANLPYTNSQHNILSHIVFHGQFFIILLHLAVSLCMTVHTCQQGPGSGVGAEGAECWLPDNQPDHR